VNFLINIFQLLVLNDCYLQKNKIFIFLFFFQKMTTKKNQKRQLPYSLFLFCSVLFFVFWRGGAGTLNFDLRCCPPFCVVFGFQGPQHRNPTSSCLRLPNSTRLLATGAEFGGVVPEERLNTLSFLPSDLL